MRKFVVLSERCPTNFSRVGMIGISQPGFHVAASLMDAHPALKAASPQAPTADYYMGDDVYHNGAFMLGANFGFNGSPRRCQQEYFNDEAAYWQEIVDHTNYEAAVFTLKFKLPNLSPSPRLFQDRARQ